jgi:hypothetical protein
VVAAVAADPFCFGQLGLSGALFKIVLILLPSHPSLSYSLPFFSGDIRGFKTG